MSEVRFNTGDPAPTAPAAPADATGDENGVQFGAPAKTAPESPPPAPAERPAWLPEKFKTPEDLVKSYGELEKARTAPKAPVKGEADPIPFDTLTAEFSEKGEISEETLTSTATSRASRRLPSNSGPSSHPWSLVKRTSPRL